MKIRQEAYGLNSLTVVALLFFRTNFGLGCEDYPLEGETPHSETAESSSLVSFDRIQATIDMEEKAVELPVPVYEMVDVLGDHKNAPGSVACGGVTSEGAAEDADACLLRPALTFTDGYLNTNTTVVVPNAAVYNGEVANFEVVGHVGDIVELTVNNRLPEAADGKALATGFFAPANNLQSVHWHGMELDNESDGTPVTEAGIETGRSRMYRFRLYRPGPFWFHPHILPLLTESRGMAGRLIVHSDAEDTLRELGVLPDVYRAITLTDVVVANETNRTLLGPGNVVFDHFSDEEVANHLLPDISPDLNGDGVCDRGAQARDCIVNEGELVLVNGRVPTGDADIETILVEQGGGVRIAFINSSNERFYRFRLLLEGEAPPFGPSARLGRATTGQCYEGPGTDRFTGADPLSCEQGLPLYRVGGEGGLLDHVRLEGQPELSPGEPARDYDLGIRRGEDVIGPAERTELVVETRDRSGDYLQPGQSMYIWTVDYPHGAFTPKFDNLIGDGQARNRDIAARKLVRIQVVEDVDKPQVPYAVAEGDPLLAHPAVARATEDLRTREATSLSAVPEGLDSVGNAFAGTTDPVVKLDNRVSDGTRFPAINNRRGQYSGVVGGIGNTLPTQGSTRYARVGDVIELVFVNNTPLAIHPFHMHGFAFQPISVHRFSVSDLNEDGVEETTLDETPIFVFAYNEFIDVALAQPKTALKFRMKINDRFRIPDAASYSLGQLKHDFPYDPAKPYGGAGDTIANGNGIMGGALGRWLFHCHILHHASLGMIADLCVAPQGDPDASGCKVDIDEDMTLPIGD